MSDHQYSTIAARVAATAAAIIGAFILGLAVYAATVPVAGDSVATGVGLWIAVTGALLAFSRLIAS